MPGRVTSTRSAASLGGRCAALNAGQRRVDRRFNFGFEFVDALADVALGFFRRGLQPEVVELGEHAVLASHPAIAEDFPVVFRCDCRRLLLQRGQQFAHRAVECRGGEVGQFGDGVGHGSDR